MKRYCNLLLLLLFLFFMRNTAKSAIADNVLHFTHIKTNRRTIPHALPKTSMEKKKPARNYTAILFRQGIEGKTVSFSYENTIDASYYPDPDFIDVVATSVSLKYLFSFPDFVALTPQFLSAFSCHAPPTLC